MHDRGYRPDTDSLLYFAYGSNLLPSRLRARTPSARIVGRGFLADHRLQFDKRGRDDSGKATVVAAPGLRVPGAIYRLAVDDLPALDAAEGVGSGYDRLVLDSALGPVMTYRAPAHHRAPYPWPFDWYRALVLAGAHYHDLPIDHRRALAAQPVWLDPQMQRAEAAWALIAAIERTEPAAPKATLLIHPVVLTEAT